MKKREKKRPLGRTKRRVEDKIKMDIQEIVLDPWTGLIWHRIGADGGRLQMRSEPSASIKCG